VTGLIVGIGGSGAACSACDELPGCITASPPGRIFPEKASRSDADSESNFDSLIEAMDHRIRNSAISRVIMSA
jgi:hypothetical protein